MGGEGFILDYVLLYFQQQKHNMHISWLWLPYAILMGEIREGGNIGCNRRKWSLVAVTGEGRLMTKCAHYALPFAMFAIVPLSLVARHLITQTVH